MQKRTKSRSQRLVPNCRQAAVEQMAQAAKTIAEIERIEADLTDEIATLKAAAADKAKGLKALLKDYLKGLETYCETNRPELTKNGKVKYHDFGTGTVRWRNLPASVKIKKADIDAVIERIKALDENHKFLRVKTEINKEAMLLNQKAAEAIEGVTIARDLEEIVLEPKLENTGD